MAKKPRTPKQFTCEQLASKIIAELHQAGFTPDQMLEVIAMAKQKYLAMVENDKSKAV